jgi:hypothetical protein
MIDVVSSYGLIQARNNIAPLARQPETRARTKVLDALRTTGEEFPLSLLPFQSSSVTASP